MLPVRGIEGCENFGSSEVERGVNIRRVRLIQIQLHDESIAVSGPAHRAPEFEDRRGASRIAEITH